MPPAPRLHGRAVALRLLHDGFARAVAGPDLVAVALRGAPGAGKTTLLNRFRQELAAAAPTSPLIGESCANPGQDRQSFFARALAEMARTAPPEGRRMSSVVGVVKRVAPAWLEVVPMVGGLLKAGYETAIAVQEQRRASPPLTEGFIRTVEDLATERPVVLLLDDLHWADRSVTDAVFELARTLARSQVPVLVVVAYRRNTTVRGAGHPPIEQLVDRLDRHVGVTLVDLPPLDRDEIRALAMDSLGYPPPEPLVHWLRRRSEGLPLFAEQLLRHLAERDLAGDLEYLTPAELTRRLAELDREIPHTVESILAERLADLEPVELAAFEAAAVLGGGGGAGFDADELAALTRVTHDRAYELVDDAVRRGLMVEVDDRYRLFHGELARLLTNQLTATPARYRRLHAKCAEQLRAEPADSLDWYRRTAYHFSAAERPDDELAVLEQARHRAEDRWQWREPLVDLLTLAADRFAGRGRSGPRARAVLMTAALLNLMQRFDVAAAAARTGYNLAVAAGDDRSQAEALCMRMGLESANNPDFGRTELADEAISRYERIGDAPATLGALFTLVGVALRTEKWTVAEDALGRADARYAAWDPAGTHPLWTGRLAQVRGELLGSTGRWADAVEPLAAALRLAEPVGIRARCAALGWHGLALARCGRMDEGLAEVREALRIERTELDSREGVAKWLCLLGRLFLETGDPARAAPPVWHSIALYEELGHTLAAGTRQTDRQIRAVLGDQVYERLRDAFDPTTSEWAGYAFIWQLGPFTKHPGNPILEPIGTGWQSIGVLNPAAVADEHGVRMLYRALGPAPDPGASANITVSTVGLAVSDDGLSFRRVMDRPLIAPTEPYEQPGGCEDPRLSQVDDQFFLTYTAFDGRVARLATAWSRDLHIWHKLGPTFTTEQWHTYFPTAERPENPPGWSKSGVLVPHRINDRWWMYFGDTHIWVAWSEDRRTWRIIRRPVLSPRPGCFDSRLVEPGPPPIPCEQGLLLIYNSADDNLRYAVGQALIDPEDPTTVLRRSGEPSLEPSTADEISGVMSNVVFASGLVRREDRWLLYYGMADTRIGAAVAPARSPA